MKRIKKIKNNLEVIVLATLVSTSFIMTVVAIVKVATGQIIPDIFNVITP